MLSTKSSMKQYISDKQILYSQETFIICYGAELQMRAEDWKLCPSNLSVSWVIPYKRLIHVYTYKFGMINVGGSKVPPSCTPTHDTPVKHVVL